MPDRHIAIAVSLAKILLNTREQFAQAIRAAAIARIEANPAQNIFPDVVTIPRHALEPHIDDALYGIGRDGLDRLDVHVRTAIDEAAREALDSTGAPRR